MNIISALDTLEHAKELLNVMSFCLMEDMPHKFVRGSGHLFFLNESITSLIESAEKLIDPNTEEDE